MRDLPALPWRYTFTNGKGEDIEVRVDSIDPEALARALAGDIRKGRRPGGYRTRRMLGAITGHVEVRNGT